MVDSDFCSQSCDSLAAYDGPFSFGVNLLELFKSVFLALDSLVASERFRNKPNTSNFCLIVLGLNSEYKEISLTLNPFL